MPVTLWLHCAGRRHQAKYRKLVSALALVFHLADGHRGPVGFAATLRALPWSVYLESHARRGYGQGWHTTAKRTPPGEYWRGSKREIWRGAALLAGMSGGRDSPGWPFKSA